MAFQKSIAAATGWLGLFTSLQPTDPALVTSSVNIASEQRTVRSLSKNAGNLIKPELPLGGLTVDFQPRLEWVQGQQLTRYLLLTPDLPPNGLTADFQPRGDSVQGQQPGRWLLQTSPVVAPPDPPPKREPYPYQERPEFVAGKTLAPWLLMDFTVIPGTPADITALIGARRNTLFTSSERSANYTAGIAIGDNVINPGPVEDPVFRWPRQTFVWPVEESARHRSQVDARSVLVLDFLGPQATPPVMQAMRLDVYFEPPYSFYRGLNTRLIVIGADVGNTLIEFQPAQRPSRRPLFVPSAEQYQRVSSTAWVMQFAPYGTELETAVLAAVRTPAFYSVTHAARYSVAMPVGPDVANPPSGGGEAQLETLIRHRWQFTPAAAEMHKASIDSRIQVTYAPTHEVVGGFDTQPYLPHTKEYAAVGRNQQVKTGLVLDFPQPSSPADISALIGALRPTKLVSIERALTTSSPIQVGADVDNPVTPIDPFVLASVRSLSRYFAPPEQFSKRIEFSRLVLNAPTYEFIGGIGSRWDFISPADYFKRQRTELLIGGAVFVPDAPLLRRARVPEFLPVVDRPIDYGRRFRVTQLDLATPAGPAAYQFRPKKYQFIPQAQTVLEHGISDGWILLFDKGGTVVPCYRRVWLLGRLSLVDYDVRPVVNDHQVRLAVETNLGASQLKEFGRLRIIELPEPYL